MTGTLKLEGVFTALVTPFTNDGQAIDYKQLESMIEYQIQEGVTGIVPMGTTGECPTVSHEEHSEIIRQVVKYVNKRVLVIAGTGSNSTKEAIELTKSAKEAGADACLVVNPYYNKPSQEGLYQHFHAIANIGLPVVLYNIPGRTGINMKPETVAKLYQLENIIAIKEATGSLEQATEIAKLCNITILSGDDGLTLPLMAIGAKGVISVFSNASPKKVLAIVQPALQGDFATAREAHLKYYSLFKSMFVETNPQPIKAAMEILGLCNSSVRLPLTKCSEQTIAEVRQQLQKHGMIN